tara:strand:+ start:413 stop:517 length:105 start_codon:yes stop_codon:yes gene_type:complete
MIKPFEFYFAFASPNNKIFGGEDRLEFVVSEASK